MSPKVRLTSKYMNKDQHERPGALTRSIYVPLVAAEQTAWVLQAVSHAQELRTAREDLQAARQQALEAEQEAKVAHAQGQRIRNALVDAEIELQRSAVTSESLQRETQVILPGKKQQFFWLCGWISGPDILSHLSMADFPPLQSSYQGTCLDCELIHDISSVFCCPVAIQ